MISQAGAFGSSGVRLFDVNQETAEPGLLEHQTAYMGDREHLASVDRWDPVHDLASDTDGSGCSANFWDDTIGRYRPTASILASR